MLAADVVISEIMHHPIPYDLGTEYIEIYNRGDAAANLLNWRFSKGIDFTFTEEKLGTNGILDPGEYLVVAANVASFQAKYPTVSNVVGGWQGRLSNSQEELELQDATGSVADKVTYADQGDWATRRRPVWPIQTVTSLTSSGTTATVRVPYHSIALGDTVRISGADQPQYNGTFLVTGSSTNTFTVTISGSAASPATGNIKAQQLNDHGHLGWEWFQAADGGGKSLELINPALSNNEGQNWASSIVENGTPGAQNSVFSGNIAPMILDVVHGPIIPKPTDPVTVSARILDELPTGVTATLHWRLDGAAVFNTVAMFDDGLHNDGAAGDGLWAGTIPAQASNPYVASQAATPVVEFYVSATDSSNHTRTFPAPALDTNGQPTQTANLLYQVDGTEYSGTQPMFKLIMTEAERAELADIGTSPGDSINEEESDAQMNGTFISIDAKGNDVRYLVGYRNRGAGSRNQQPNNYRVNLNTDRPWRGLTAMNLNGRYSMEEIVGSAIFRMAGLAAQDAIPVQVRVNGVNLAAGDTHDMFGSYSMVEAENTEFVDNHFPTDSSGNYYRAVRRRTDNTPNADLSYDGEDPNLYRLDYNKKSNVEDDDWSDLIKLLKAFNTTQTPDSQFVQAMYENINVTQWLRYFAVSTLIGDRETTLATGVGDDYDLYRGMIDPRFQVIVHDLDTVMGRGDTSPIYNDSIWRGTGVAAINRFLKHPAFAPLYYEQLLDVIHTVFSPEQLNPLLDNLLGSYVPQGIIDTMKQFAVDRINGNPALTNGTPGVLAQIPQAIAFTTAPYTRVTAPSMTIAGTANAVTTRSIKVNGIQATWSAWEGKWTASAVPLHPGVNRVFVQAFDADGSETDHSYISVWYDDSTVTNVAGGTLAADQIWTAANGPYQINGTLTIPSGRTLTIEAGTAIHVGSGVNIVVQDGGRIIAQGTETQRIVFTRIPGTTNTWGEISIAGSASSPENRFSYVNFEHAASYSISSNGGTLFLDHLTFGSNAQEYLELDASSFILQDSEFPDAASAFEFIHAKNGIKAGGRAIFLRNFFGSTTGYSDVIDFTGGNRPGPIPQFIDNVFSGASDDDLDLDSTDAWVQGNIFLHVHKNGPPDTSSAISGGADNADTSQVTAIGNIFYDVDHAAMGKQGNFFTLINNTIVRQTHVGGLDSTGAVICTQDNNMAEGRGMLLEGNIIYDIENLVRDQETAIVTFRDNLMPLPWSGPGGGNSVADPRFKHVPQMWETNFRTWSQAQVMRDWLSLLPDSPAIGAGPNGADQGGVIPMGATIGGAPVGVTNQTGATLTIGVNRTGDAIPTSGFPNGSGFVSYRWRLDGGAWSAPTPITTPITLTGLTDGTHQVDVVALSDANLYQNDSLLGPDARITSASWTVDSALTRTSHVRINEILASNTHTLNNSGAYPDLVELYNDGPDSIDLSGMSLTDDPANVTKFIFPQGTTIAGGQYLVLYADSATGLPGIHLGFSLKETGESLGLYDSTGNKIDEVVFGQQLEDYSIGRMADGTWTLTVPTFGAANVLQPMSDPRNAKINEWLTEGIAPFSNDFVEIYNPGPLPIDLGGYFLSDEPNGWPDRFRIRPLTFAPGKGMATFKADNDPYQGADHTNFQLASAQGMIGLFDSALTRIDAVLYGTQRAGVSQGRTPDGDPHFDFFAQPSPGITNPAVTQQTQTINLFGITDLWRYNQSRTDLGTAWRAKDYVDTVAGWNEGGGLLYVEGSSLPAPKTTPLSLGGSSGSRTPTFYFRKHFTLNVDPAEVKALLLQTVLDDEAIIYINGVKVYSIGLPDNAVVNYSTYGETVGGRTVDNAVYEAFTLPQQAIDALVKGDNVIAVEVHQINGVSTDVVWGATLAVQVAVASMNPVPLRVTELMYNAPGAGALPGDDFEYVELMNVGSEPLNLAGYKVSGGIDAVLGNVSLAPGARGVLVKNLTSFTQRYGSGINILGTYTGSLDNGGEQIRLQDATSAIILDFAYSDAWARQTDGDGYSLIINNPDSAPSVWGMASNWKASNAILGTPGLAESGRAVDSIRINEVLSHSHATAPDWIELYNAGSEEVDLSGWYLSDSSGHLASFKIPSGASSILQPGQYLVLYQNDPDGFGSVFGLSELGETLYLSESLSDGVLGSYRNSVKFGGADTGISFGRYVNSQGTVQYPPMSIPTPGSANSSPRVGPIVISELMYHPSGSAPEFIELKNITDQDVPLYDPLIPANTWRFTDGIDYVFPASSMVPANGVALVVPISPATFRSQYGIPDSVPIYGPYTNAALSNNGERVSISKPGGPDLDGTIPWIIVDQVEYGTDLPWPTSADGQGPSLTRIDVASWGDDAGNWEAGPDGGTPGVAQSIVSQITIPASQVISYLKRDGDLLKIWGDESGTGTPINSLPFASLKSMNILGGTSSANRLILDLSGGDVLPAGLLKIDSGLVKLELAGSTTLNIQGLLLGSLAKLDIGKNSLNIVNGDLTQVTAWLASARNATPRWSGVGLGTTLANADQGLAVNQVGSDVKVKFTWNGDLNLDGRVNADDYFYIDQGFLQKPSSPKYHDGDFNFDGKINADDYFLIDQAFLNQKGVVLSAPKPALATTTTTTRKAAVRESVFSTRKVRRQARRFRAVR